MENTCNLNDACVVVYSFKICFMEIHLYSVKENLHMEKMRPVSV